MSGACAGLPAGDDAKIAANPQNLVALVGVTLAQQFEELGVEPARPDPAPSDLQQALEGTLIAHLHEILGIEPHDLCNNAAAFVAACRWRPVPVMPLFPDLGTPTPDELVAAQAVVERAGYVLTAVPEQEDQAIAALNALHPDLGTRLLAENQEVIEIVADILGGLRWHWRPCISELMNYSPPIPEDWREFPGPAG